MNVIAPVNVIELLATVVGKGGDAESEYDEYGFKTGYLCTMHLTWPQQYPSGKNHVNFVNGSVWPLIILCRLFSGVLSMTQPTSGNRTCPRLAVDHGQGCMMSLVRYWHVASLNIWISVVSGHLGSWIMLASRQLGV